ncbi:MAG: EamA family transporter [Candidatus Lambdaproteobacteria bacterium]|nr:EamA family transporter [Candidatus Lambdaproteobacteria bacterium]
MWAEGHVSALVILAALLHASWNAMLKRSEDALVTMGVVMTTGVAMGALAIPFLPPLPAACWVYLALSVLLHLAYQLILVQAYRIADLSQVFPIFRGIPPVLVASFSGLVAGELLAPTQVLGVAAISLGIGSLALHRGLPRGQDRLALAWALGTAVAITAYTFADGLGVRLSGNALTYAAWLFFFNGIPYALFAWWRRRAALWPVLGRVWPQGLGAGVVAIGGFTIVLWAFARAPLAPVAALRETSVIFAALIGTLLLREPFGRLRLVAAVLVVLGIVLLHLGR